MLCWTSIRNYTMLTQGPGIVCYVAEDAFLHFHREADLDAGIFCVVALASKVAQQAFSYHWAISRWQNRMLVFPQRRWTSICKRDCCFSVFQLETFELWAQNVLRHSAQHTGTRRNTGRFDADMAESKRILMKQIRTCNQQTPIIPLHLVPTHLTLAT